MLSAVVIPILAIYGYARIQKSLLGFAAALGKIPALIFGILIFSISISIPCPRTASVTYEMAVAPYIDFPSLSFSLIYFGLVLILALNRSQLLNLIGKYLTPLIVLIVVTVIILGLSADGILTAKSTNIVNPLAFGFLEGYQTFDAIGGVVVGSVLVVSLSFEKKLDFMEKKRIVARAGVIAGLALFAIYMGLIALGAHYDGATIETRTGLLQFLSTETLGGMGALGLSVLISLACFTTAVGIVVGMADFFSEVFGQSKKVFTLTVIIGCLIGVLVGQFSVPFIIKIAIPVLLLIYPITIVLIVINSLPNRYHKTHFFRIGVTAAVIFSLPDFIAGFINLQWLNAIRNSMPLSEENLGWLFPTAVVLLLVGLYFKWEGFKLNPS